MDLKKIVLTVDSGICVIHMNYPQNLNSMDEDMVAEFMYCFDRAAKEDVRVVVIKGLERSFSAGGDIQYFYDRLMENTIGEFEIIKQVFELSNRIRKFPKPVIASCSGAVAGAGCNLALSCDFVICADNVKFIQAFVNIALAPDTGGLFLLAKDIGWHKTMDLVMTGRVMKAQEGYDLGLFFKLSKPEELEKDTMEFAAKLANGPGVAYAKIKKMMYDAVFSNYEAYGPLEHQSQVECSRTYDFKEGIVAFLEKRKAQFKGK